MSQQSEEAGSGAQSTAGSTLRWTLIGAALGGGLFGALSVYRSVASGGPVLEHLNPIAVLTVIGLTVGGLIGPMMGAIVTRLRNR